MSEELEKPKGIIYKITSPSGKIYIGQTTKSLEYRWKQHVKDAMNENRKRCRVFHNAIQKYGEENMIQEVVCECNTDELDKNENRFIAELNTLTPNGYNLKTNKLGQKKGEVTEKFKENVSQAVLNYYENNPKAEASREKMRVAKQKFHQTTEVKHKNEVKQKITDGLKAYYTNNKHTHVCYEISDDLPKHFHSICISNENERHTFVNLTEAGKFLNCNRATVRRHIGKEYNMYKISNLSTSNSTQPNIIIIEKNDITKEFRHYKEVAKFFNCSDRTMRRYIQYEKIVDGYKIKRI